MARIRFAASIALAVSVAPPALAHNALMSCFANPDGTVDCEAGYSDGASAAGQIVRVMQTNKRLIVEGVFDKQGNFRFKKPDVPFYVEFFGDPAHIAVVDGEDVVQ